MVFLVSCTPITDLNSKDESKIGSKVTATSAETDHLPLDEEKKADSNKTDEPTIIKDDAVVKASTPVNENPSVIIYAIAPRGNKETPESGEFISKNEFIILYNTTDANIKINNWKLRNSGSGNGLTYKTFVDIESESELIIKSKSYFLITGDGYDSTKWKGDTAPDFTKNNELGISNEGAHIQLVDEEDKEHDRVGYGKSTKLPEGESITFSPSKAIYMYRTNEILDTNNNAVDFTVVEYTKEVFLKNSNSK